MLLFYFYFGKPFKFLWETQICPDHKIYSLIEAGVSVNKYSKKKKKKKKKPYEVWDNYMKR